MKQGLHSMIKRGMFLNAFVVMLLTFGTTAYAQEIEAGGTWGGIDWTLDTEGTLTISPTTSTPTKDNSGKWSYTVGQWPEAVKYTSTGGAADIGLWPYQSVKDKIKRLVIEEGVTSIGSFAIASNYCSFPNLGGELLIPWTVNYIGQEAFMATKFTEITFQEVPAGKTGGALCIAQGAFKKLIVEEFAFPEDRDVYIHPYVLNNCTQLKHVVFPATIKGFSHNNVHIDYNTHKIPNPSDHGNFSGNAILSGSNALATITFGSEAVKTLFKTSNAATYNSLTFLGLTGYITKNGMVSEFQINDGSYAKFENNYDALKIAKLIYNRTLLPVGTWNALYLPFELPVSALGSNYDVAYYNNMHARDRDNNGTIESLEMELILIKEGTLHAHHPYFVRAKNQAAVDMNLSVNSTSLFRTMPKVTYEEVEVEDDTAEGDGESTEGDTAEGEGKTTITVEKVEKVEHTVITTSSAYLDYTLAGTYNTEADVEDFEAMSGTKYAIASDGSWAKTNAPAPFRVYLTIAERPDSPMKIEAQALARVRIRVAGEDATSIDEVEMPISGQPVIVYDLQGRRVFNTEDLKGIYIVNGKKVAF